jgi:hypothetical protein
LLYISQGKVVRARDGDGAASFCLPGAASKLCSSATLKITNAIPRNYVLKTSWLCAWNIANLTRRFFQLDIYGIFQIHDTDTCDPPVWFMPQTLSKIDLHIPKDVSYSLTLWSPLFPKAWLPVIKFGHSLIVCCCCTIFD